MLLKVQEVGVAHDTRGEKWHSGSGIADLSRGIFAPPRPPQGALVADVGEADAAPASAAVVPANVSGGRGIGSGTEGDEACAALDEDAELMRELPLGEDLVLNGGRPRSVVRPRISGAKQPLGSRP